MSANLKREVFGAIAIFAVIFALHPHMAQFFQCVGGLIVLIAFVLVMELIKKSFRKPGNMLR